MNKTFFIQRTYYKLFKWNIFTKTEVYTELNGESSPDKVIELLVEEEYFQREFNLKNEEDDKK